MCRVPSASLKTLQRMGEKWRNELCENRDDGKCVDINEQVSEHAGHVVNVGQHLEPAAAGKDFALNQGKALRIELSHLKSPKAFPKANSCTHSLTQAGVERQKAEEIKGKYKEYFGT